MQVKQDYYVYVHRRLDNDIVFYVGSGRLNRAYQKSNRNKEWLEIISTTDYAVEWLATNLDCTQARKLEEKYITNPNKDWQLVNKRLPTKPHDLNYEFLSNYFYYDETSPSGLRYKINVYKNKGAISKFAGQVAGNIQKRNGTPIRWRLKVTIGGDKTVVNIHRIVWILCKQVIDNRLVIDHIDGNPLNNRIENLRQVPQQVNARNKCSGKMSCLGIAGLSLKKGSYKAEILDGDRRTGKSFSISKYGESLALYLAAKARYSFLAGLDASVSFTSNASDIDKLLSIINEYEINNNNNKE